MTPKNTVLAFLGEETTGLDAQAQNPARLTGDEHEGFWFHILFYRRDAKARRNQESSRSIIVDVEFIALIVIILTPFS